MDKRVALPAGYQLHFPGMCCIVEGEVGRGLNAIVYRGWYQDASDRNQRHNVLVKELFPYHEKGVIYRAEEDDTIHCRENGKGTMEMHRDSFKWGNKIHLHMKNRYPDETGGNINTYEYHNTYYTILDFSGGRTLEKDMVSSKDTLTLRKIAQRCVGILDSLRLFHQEGCLHLDISPDNILLMNYGRKERIELIDYNSVFRIEQAEQDDTLRFSMKQGFHSPEVRRHDIRHIGTWTDLYSVAAVFYYCLMGQTLSRMQLCGLVPVQVQESRYLREVPETVKSMIRKILQRGLAGTERKRYQKADEMLRDFEELINRIDGIGITHWSLWETGRKSICRELHANTRFSYLTEEETLYPMSIKTEKADGIQAFLHGSGNVVLTGSGGTGKTTFLLWTAWKESQRYCVDRPAALYLSLHEYCAGNENFIHDRILQRLRFLPETDSYASARHTLDLLLQKPLRTSKGRVPVLCLLLDGYNEISGEAHHLQMEIEQLAKLEGVSILITSRYPLAQYSFEQWEMEPLTEQAVTDILNQNGLLVPENEEIRTLLTNALMLSLFVHTCLNEGGQVTIESREELMQAYLDAMLEKEIQSLPESSERKWQLEAAVRCVFPAAAYLEEKQMMSGEMLFRRIREIYDHLGRKILQKRFPAWAGHAKEIRGEATDAEEWYGIMIHEILWKRLGLLAQEEDGGYRIFHQEFHEILDRQGQELLEVFRKKKTAQIFMMSGAGIAMLIMLCCLLKPLEIESYDAEKAVEMLEHAQTAANTLFKEVTDMTEFLEKETPDFENIRQKLNLTAFMTVMDTDQNGEVLSEYRERAENLLATGKRLPWNESGFDKERLLEAVELTRTYSERYQKYVDTLEAVSQEGSQEEYEHCCVMIHKVVEADTRACAAYYKIVCELRLDGLAAWESTADGSDFAGAFKRFMDNSQVTEEIQTYLDEWEDTGLGDMAHILEQALDDSCEARSKMSEDVIYVQNMK